MKTSKIMENRYSVLMSVYKKERPEYLRQSIESMLNQTVKSDDIWIVCDGPLTTELDYLVNEYEKRYPGIIHILRLQENVGLGRALNEGMKSCRYSIIARMDTDDIAFEERCEKQIAVINSGIDIVSGTVLEFEASIENVFSRRELPQKHDDIVKFARRRNPFNHPCVMYRKEFVEKAGGYRHFYLFEDYYLWARMLKIGVKTANIKEPVLYMRAGGDMYRRRGGIKYIKSMVKFRYFLWKSGISSLGDFIYTIMGQSLICLLPNGFRTRFYKKFLRK